MPLSCRKQKLHPDRERGRYGKVIPQNNLTKMGWQLPRCTPTSFVGSPFPFVFCLSFHISVWWLLLVDIICLRASAWDHWIRGVGMWWAWGEEGCWGWVGLECFRMSSIVMYLPICSSSFRYVPYFFWYVPPVFDICRNFPMLFRIFRISGVTEAGIPDLYCICNIACEDKNYLYSFLKYCLSTRICCSVFKPK